MTDRLSAHPDGIGRAAEILRGGGIVAIPTDTVYGLAGLDRVMRFDLP